MSTPWRFRMLACRESGTWSQSFETTTWAIMLVVAMQLPAPRQGKAAAVTAPRLQGLQASFSRRSTLTRNWAGV